MPTQVDDNRRSVPAVAGTPTGYEKLAVGATAVSPTPSTTTTNYALIVCEDAIVRWRDDGTSPTASEGIPLFINQSMVIAGRDSLTNIEFIRTGGTSASLKIAYYNL